MGSAVNNVLAGGEENDNPIPGADEDNTGDFTDMGAAPASTPPIAPAPSPAQPPSPVQVDSSQKVHPHMAILAGMLNRVLGGIQNAPGNSRNAFDRGFMQASPDQQAMTQAAIGKAQSAADLEKMQVTITGLKALQMEYMIKRLPQDDQMRYLKTISDFKESMIKSGAKLEMEGDSETASDGQAKLLNQTDPRARAGTFYSIPTLDSNGKAKYDVIFQPNKEVLQDDFPWTDSAGVDRVIPKGTPLAIAKLIEQMSKDVKDKTKEETKKMQDALGPVEDQKAEGTADYLQRLQKENNALYQQNKQGVDAAIPSLRAQAQRAQQGKERVAAAGAARIEERQLTGKQAVVDTAEGPEMVSAKEAASRTDDFTTLSGTQAMQIRDKRANADASINALQNYRKSFSDFSDKLSSTDRDNLRVLTAHVQQQSSGILGGIIDDLPLAGPLSQYANRLLQGTMTSDAFKHLSPEGKTLLAQYSMAVVANFANMKQMLGSVGRNPAMIQAEMNQIPLPYIDSVAAEKTLATKLSDVKQRNSSIPRVKGSRKSLDEINREGIWEVSHAE